MDNRAMDIAKLHQLDELLADEESLTVARISAYLATHRLATANWFGPTGRPQSSSWIERDGTGWRVWETDERAGGYFILRTESETEAVDNFLRRARRYLAADSTAVRRGF